jgi:hypothetical protein
LGASSSSPATGRMTPKHDLVEQKETVTDFPSFPLFPSVQILRPIPDLEFLFEQK